LGFVLISGARVVAEAILKRWLTPRGSCFWDLDLGHDVRQYLSAAIDSTRLSAIETQLAAEAQKDERVESCTVTASFDPTAKRFTLKSRVTLVEGETFSFVVGVDALTAELFFQEAA
jgi:hypothetical protein